MRISPTIVSALVASVGFAGHSGAFVPSKAPIAPTNGRTAATCSWLWSSTTDEVATPCDIATDVDEVVLNSASALRQARLTNVKGEQVVLGDLFQENTSNVVIFLRHMGWPYCWTYANDWEDVREQLKRVNVGGPIFVSIGDSEKLETFLEQNPAIDPNSILVDGYDFGAYEAAGFGKFTDADPEAVKEVKMEAPGLGFGQWMGYFKAVGKVSPIPKGMKFGEIPEGVLRLGGTFVVKNDEIVYQWSDRIPGDHPDIAEVVSIAEKAAGK